MLMVCIVLPVAQSKTAGVTFLLMTEHEFRGIVYDTNAHQLFANLYVYGYKRDKLPVDYEPQLPAYQMSLAAAAEAVPFDRDELIELKGVHRGSTSSGAGSMATAGLTMILTYLGAFVW